jgi:ankyrin repeat protein
LFIAAQHGYLDVVRLLLDKGANKDSTNNVGALLL